MKYKTVNLRNFLMEAIGAAAADTFPFPKLEESWEDESSRYRINFIKHCSFIFMQWMSTSEVVIWTVSDHHRENINGLFKHLP